MNFFCAQKQSSPNIMLIGFCFFCPFESEDVDLWHGIIITTYQPTERPTDRERSQPTSHLCEMHHPSSDLFFVASTISTQKQKKLCFFNHLDFFDTILWLSATRRLLRSFAFACSFFREKEITYLYNILTYKKSRKKNFLQILSLIHSHSDIVGKPNVKIGR